MAYSSFLNLRSSFSFPWGLGPLRCSRQDIASRFWNGRKEENPRCCVCLMYRHTEYSIFQSLRITTSTSASLVWPPSQAPLLWCICALWFYKGGVHSIFDATSQLHILQLSLLTSRPPTRIPPHLAHQCSVLSHNTSPSHMRTTDTNLFHGGVDYAAHPSHSPTTSLAPRSPHLSSRSGESIGLSQQDPGASTHALLPSPFAQEMLRVTQSIASGENALRLLHVNQSLIQKTFQSEFYGSYKAISVEFLAVAKKIAEALDLWITPNGPTSTAISPSQRPSDAKEFLHLTSGHLQGHIGSLNQLLELQDDASNQRFSRLFRNTLPSNLAILKKAVQDLDSMAQSLYNFCLELSFGTMFYEPTPILPASAEESMRTFEIINPFEAADRIMVEGLVNKLRVVRVVRPQA